MRKILFRGRNHAGKWRKGSLITRIEESPAPETAVPYVVHYIKGQDFEGEEHEVDPETIGQLVSSATEEHPEIWEGDIIEICGMSVPPIMMAQISSRIYEQWLTPINEANKQTPKQ